MLISHGPSGLAIFAPRARKDFEDTTLCAGESRRDGPSGKWNRLMPSKRSDDQKLADQANDLYWRSGRSVNHIAEAMDLSKSGLYALVRPLPADCPCPECGAGLVFPNRTAMDKAIASCLECEYEGGAQPDVEKKGAAASTPPADDGEPESDLAAGPGGSAERAAGGGRGRRSNRVLWAAVLLGVAAGLYVTRRSR